jgi:hypothetical protein
MIHRLATYKVRDEKITEAREALAKFVKTTREQGPRDMEISIFCEHDGLTHHHYSSFPDEQTSALHGNSVYFADFWEVLYECCETFSQSVELESLHTITT